MIEEVKSLLANKNLTLVFEVIDPVNDPHIVEYSKREIILSDAVKRELDFQKMSFDYLIELSKEFSFNLKLSLIHI